jgi:hypothetical protein
LSNGGGGRRSTIKAGSNIQASFFGTQINADIQDILWMGDSLLAIISRNLDGCLPYRP